MLVINADDYGLDRNTTDRILACFKQRRIHSASVMTFMTDSERAAELAGVIGLPVGLHLNLVQEYNGPQASSNLRKHQSLVSNYLMACKWNQIIYNPFLRNSFEYIYKMQYAEFIRLFGVAPQRLDGHHHMHLCMNILVSGIIEKGITIRRNFTFMPHEKDIFNRYYRRLVDRWLVSRYKCTDSFYSIEPIMQDRLQRLVSMSRSTDVEIMVHPGIYNEYSFLLSAEWGRIIGVC